MAKKNFDFEEFQELNMAKYLKLHCKPVAIKKAGAGIFLQDYKLNGKKVSITFIPFKKLAEAVLVFKQIKTDKVHILKKVALVSILPAPKGEIHVVTKKGGLSGEVITAKGTDFFMSNFKLKLVATAGATKEDSTADGANSATKEDSAMTEKRLISYKKIAENINKLTAAGAKLSEEKLTTAIQKYEKVLSSLENEAMVDGEIDVKEQTQITQLKNSLKKLANKESKAKKLTPEKKAKIKENMDKISSKLASLIKNLDL